MFPFDILFRKFGEGDKVVHVQSIVFHTVIAVIIFGILMFFVNVLVNVNTAPLFPTGWNDRPSYEALIPTRKSLTDYAAGYTPTAADLTKTPMRLLTVATANYGGIFTEKMSPPFYPYVGTVDPEAARLQVEAGARAIILDIWPDPANRANPVVCSMVDTTVTGRNTLSWWTNTGGLDKGVGRYSNWQLATRNKVSADKILNAAVQAAFNTTNSPQNGDPFFLILNLHGAMTTDYLNKLGAYVQAAIGPNGMPSEWNRNANASALATEPVATFMNKCFVIVCPDIQQNFNSLPGINTYEKFVPIFLNTTLGEATNLLQSTANTILFTPSNAAMAKSLTPTSFCVVQGSVGDTNTDNDHTFGTSFQQCTQYGIQFIGVNLLTPGDSDNTLQTFFSPKFFKDASFYFTSPPTS
jgi:hypothetical protein